MMNKIFLGIATCIFFTTCVGAVERIQYQYGSGNIDPKNPVEKPLKNYKIFGERCSGTNYLENLIIKNCPKLTEYREGGPKHFPCWFGYPFDKDYYKRGENHYTLKGSEDVLYLVIFRDPYDWLRSFHNQTHNGAPEMQGIPFKFFIRSPWLAKPNNRKYFIEQDPETRKPFKNVIKLRTARIKNMLMIKDIAKHVYFINYETLNSNPEAVLEEIHNIFGIDLNKEFLPVEYYKGKIKEGKYTGSHYPAISPSDTKFINQQLDENLERQIGYELISLN